MANQGQFSLEQGARQSLKQTQRLMMSHEMQQAIHTLQMPLPELAAAMRQEIALNPIFEEIHWVNDGIELSINEPPLESDLPSKEMEFSEDDFSMMTRLDDEFRDLWAEAGNYSMQRTQEEAERKSYQENSIPSHLTLYESLLEQAREQLASEEEVEAARQILGNLDETGLLTTPIEEIAALSGIAPELLQQVVLKIQRFTPIGLAACSLQESLLIQLEERGLLGTTAYKIVESHFDDLLRNRLRPIERDLGLPMQEIEAAIHEEIALLNIHPSSGFTEGATGYLVADVTIEENESGGLIAHVNNESLPSLRFNQRYIRMLRDPSISPELRGYIEERLSSGRWLQRTVNQRGDTLLHLANYLIKHQTDFISDPSGELKPMTMKEVAEALEVHESTIARAASQKNLHCPRGLIPLRSLFTNGYTTSGGSEISAQTVREQIQQIVKREDRRNPLSDEAISIELKGRGIQCARRTVAKHRNSLGIGNQAQRRTYS